MKKIGKLLLVAIIFTAVLTFTLINAYAGWVTEPDSWNLPNKWYMNVKNGSKGYINKQFELTLS